MSGRREVIVSTAGGFCYLFAYGVVWLAVGLMSFASPRRTAAALVVALPCAGLAGTWLMARVVGLARVAGGNPVGRLLLALYAVPLLLVPVLALVWWREPALVTAVAATVFGAHLIPMAWLQQSRAHLAAGLTLAIGIPLLTVFFADGAFHLTGVATGVVLLITAFIAYLGGRRHGRRASD